MNLVQKIGSIIAVTTALSGCYDIKKDMKVEGVNGNYRPVSQTYSKNEVIYSKLDKTKPFATYIHADNQHKTVCGTWNYEIKDDGKKNIPRDYLHQKVQSFTDTKEGCTVFEQYKK